MRCLVFGATGYIGGRLVPDLLEAGHQVRVVARNLEKLSGVPWRAQVEEATADVLDPASIARAVDGQEVVYFLMHSLNRRDFTAVDRRGAQTVAAAAEAAGVSRIVYLGGLHPAGVELSAHLASRTEVGEILLDAKVPTIVLQAAVIIGSGSASFEMLRYLTERLPAMVTPRWVHNRIQPIAIRDVLLYLVASADLPGEVNRTFDIGGPDVLTYLDMMHRYSAVAGLRHRIVVPVPVLSPWLSAQWVNLVTPVPRSIAVPLIESLVNEVVCTENDIVDYIPDPPGGLIRFERSVELALSRIRAAQVPTRWSDASWPEASAQPSPTDPEWSGGSMYEDLRMQETTASPAAVWKVVEGIGGDNGWYSFPLAWAARGWMDRIVGGAGLRRGRRDPERLHVGEALDWWRVEELEPGTKLRLQAEMRLPGRAWLELSVAPADGSGTEYRQRAAFEPRGLAGHLYWKCLLPFHNIIFGGMVRNIMKAAERAAGPAAAPGSSAEPGSSA